MFLQYFGFSKQSDKKPKQKLNTNESSDVHQLPLL